MANFVSSETFADSEIIFARRSALALARADSSQDIMLGSSQDVAGGTAQGPDQC